MSVALAAGGRRKTYVLGVRMRLTREQKENPLGKNGIVLWGIHRQFGPWVILPSFLDPEDIEKVAGKKSYVRADDGDMLPVSIEEKGTGYRYFLVRRCDLRNTLMNADAVFSDGGAGIIQSMSYLDMVPIMVQFDDEMVERTLGHSGLKEKDLLKRVFKGTQSIERVTENAHAYVATRPDQEHMFLRWLAPILSKSTVFEYTVKRARADSLANALRHFSL